MRTVFTAQMSISETAMANIQVDVTSRIAPKVNVVLPASGTKHRRASCHCSVFVLALVFGFPIGIMLPVRLRSRQASISSISILQPST
jgi:ABC-type antimicrobial peptide transport system permease subunit